MNIAPVSNNNSPNFGASYPVYFWATNGKRIISNEYMSKCLHILEKHLNPSKRAAKGKFVRNQEIIDIFTKNDEDYKKNPIIRLVPNKTGRQQGFLTIVTGDDVNKIGKEYGSKIGRNKKASIEELGHTGSFEVGQSVEKYKISSPEDAEKVARFDAAGNKIYVWAYFEPIYKKNGEVKKFEFSSVGFDSTYESK